ncbi:MAG: glycosyltransferase [Anaerolineae bacterium]
MPENILILTSDAGFGHRSAARAIRAALEATDRKLNITVANPIESDDVPDFIKQREADYDEVVRNMPELYRASFQASNIPAASSMLEAIYIVTLYDIMRRTIEQHKPDLIISVFPTYQAPLAALFFMTRIRIPLMTVVTDLATVQRLWFHSASDVCVVPTDRVRRRALKAGLAPDKVLEIGIPVDPKLGQSIDQRAVREELGWEQDLMTLLVVGSDRVLNLPRMLRPLNFSKLPIQLALVAGGSDELHLLFKAQTWHPPAHIYNFVDNMPEMMHAADCVVSKAGGLIVTESLACGRPLLLVDVIEGQETGNVNYVLDHGAGHHITDPIDMLETVFHWTQEDKLPPVARNARQAGRPRAAHRIAEEAVALMDRGPSRTPAPAPLDETTLPKLLKRFGIRPNA